MITQDKKADIATYLLDTIKRTVFNEIALELDNNIKIHKISNDTNFNYFIYNNTIMRLPDDGRANIIYKLDLSQTSGLIFTKDANFPYQQHPWESLTNYCNANNVTLDIFDNNNNLIHKSAIKINSTLSNSTLYLAIDINLLYKLNYNYDSLFVNIFRDSNVLNDKIIYTYDSTEDEETKIQDIITLIDGHSNKDQLYIYVNGRYYSYDKFNLYILSLENFYSILYIDLYIDNNVLLSHTFDSISDLKYYTKDDLSEKYVLHIPKDKNPDKKMFTFDTIDIFLMDANGVKFPYFDLTSVAQLTFNDISINKSIVDMIMDTFGVSDMSLEIKIRYYDKDNILYRNKTFTDILYMYYSDNEIIDILSENSTDERLNCIWGGNKLEISKYIESLFQYPQIDNVDDFILNALEVFGYYKLSSFINNIEYDYLSLVDNTTEISVSKNELFKDEDLHPLLTKNGLLDLNFTYTQTADDIDLTLTVPANSTDKLHVKTIPKLINEYTYFTPNSGNDIVVFNKASVASSLIGVKIFLEQSQVSEIPDIDNSVLTTMYLPIDNADETYFLYSETDTEITISFKLLSYGLNFVIGYDDHFSHYIRKENIDLSTETEFTFMLTDGASNPYLYIPSILVFLNGQILIEEIDFHLVEFINTDTSIGGYRLVIQNLKYLEVLNTIDVFISSLSNHDIFQQKHYLLDNTISCDDKLDTNLENITIFLDGKILHSNDYEFRDITLLPYDTFLESSPYQFEMFVSKSCKDWLYDASLLIDCGALGSFTENNNLEYIRNITVTNRDMLSNLDQFLTENIELTSPDEDILIEILSNCNNDLIPSVVYDIHSSYTNRILQLMDDGIIVIPPSIYNAENPDPIEIEALLSPYSYLKVFDLIIEDNALLSKHIEIIFAYDDDLIINGPEGVMIILDYIQENYFNIA